LVHLIARVPLMDTPWRLARRRQWPSGGARTARRLPQGLADRPASCRNARLSTHAFHLCRRPVQPLVVFIWALGGLLEAVVVADLPMVVAGAPPLREICIAEVPAV